ncbi:DEAD/DEAH box helicase, partial [Veillonellaceae bacterium M2-4]|nr:DEAD/DEAH box helicase [Veillonellaceae bacterium M2-4]
QSEEDQDELYKLLRKYNKEVEVLKQYDLGTDDEGNEIGYDYDHPEKLLQKMDISENDEKMITTVLPNLITKELHDRNREMPDIDLRMTHIKEVVINYDYLTHLIEELI